ncbi:MAG: transposase [Anaerolineales bacterium]|nr:transposase [Anaerolineales bacterium]
MTKEVLTVTNETYINAESVCLLLSDIAQRYGHPFRSPWSWTMPVIKVCFGFGSRRLLEDRIVVLPAYSPQLNLIERLWRFVRKECLYSKYYADFATFKQAIATCIETAHTEHREELDTLLAWNFQSFKKVQFLPV